MARSFAGAARSHRHGHRTVAVVGVVLALLLAWSVPGLGAAHDDTAAPSPSPELLDERLLDEVLSIIERRYVDLDAVTVENLTEGAIRGMVEALGDDGHTVFLTPEELEVERDALDGLVVGIGVVVDHRSGTPAVISVVDGAPADLAGLVSGDVIVSVDGTDTSRLPLDDLIDLIRGDVDSVVRVGVERPGRDTVLEFDIRRDNVEIEPASWALAPGSDVAVVRIVQFSADAARDTREVISAALESGASGIVLDLRGNPGGLVDEAMDVAGSFIDEGVGYLQQGRDGPPGEVMIEAGGAIAPDIPLVVLVDYGTASSAEILAAALRDNGRAPIVGEATYGTGTVLNTFSLSDGSALRIGVLSWLTPSGEAVFRVGVAPDHPVGLPIGAVALVPGDLVGMTADEFARSRDEPLLRAVELAAAAPS